MAATHTHRKELAHRSSAGIDVALYWGPERKTITVEVLDLRTDEFFSFEVAPGLALDAFHHPFGYLAVVETGEEIEQLEERLAA
jgi:hypothetical protein